MGKQYACLSLRDVVHRTTGGVTAWKRYSNRGVGYGVLGV